MEINLSKIVPADELSIDTNLVLEKLRETQELVVFENNQPQFVIVSLSEFYKRPNPSALNILTVEDSSKPKIGKLAQESFRRLFYKQILPEEEVYQLTLAEYSNSVFNLNFPVLKEYNPAMSFDEQKRDANGYNRYYSFALSAYGKQYLLCSQWIEHLHREKLEHWLLKWNEAG